MTSTPIKEIYDERVKSVQEQLQKMERHEADVLAHELGLGIETVRRIRRGKAAFKNPTMNILAPLDEHFIKNPIK